MKPDTYFDWENPPGDLEHGDFLMLGDELDANLMLVKESRPSEEGAVCWTLALIGGPHVNVGEEQTWPTLYIQKDGALLMYRVNRGLLPVSYRVEDAVLLGINLADDPNDPLEAFDRAIAQAGLPPL